MASFLLKTVSGQLAPLVEKYEPQLEASLRSTLSNMKAKYPGEAQVFLTNWAKLDKAVRETLSNSPVPVAPVAPSTSLFGRLNSARATAYNALKTASRGGRRRQTLRKKMKRGSK